MAGLVITKNRTEGMSASEITEALDARRLQICPYEKLGAHDTDEILEGLLYSGCLVCDKSSPRTMSVTKLGTDPEGMPAACLSITTQSGTELYTEPLCGCCPLYSGCGHTVFLGMPEPDDIKAN